MKNQLEIDFQNNFVSGEENVKETKLEQRSFSSI